MSTEVKKTPSLSLDFDYARYAHHLDHEDMSEEEKRECLGALWSILSQFVMLGFDVHPVQQAGSSCIGACACGKLVHEIPKPANSSKPALYSVPTSTNNQKGDTHHEPA